MIEVTDALGAEWRLTFHRRARHSENEIWLRVWDSPMQDYATIHVPVFTDWWPA